MKQGVKTTPCFFSVIQFNKLEVGGESPLTMCHGLRRSNSILSDSRPVAGFALRMEFENLEFALTPSLRGLARRKS